MLLNPLPEALIILDSNRLARIKFIQSPQIHLTVQERDDIFVESLPVWVLQVVPVR